MTDDPQTTARKDWRDAEDALSILVACGQDVERIEAAIPPSRRSSRFNAALTSLKGRIAVGVEMQDTRRGR